MARRPGGLGAGRPPRYTPSTARSRSALPTAAHHSAERGYQSPTAMRNCDALCLCPAPAAYGCTDCCCPRCPLAVCASACGPSSPCTSLSALPLLPFALCSLLPGCAAVCLCSSDVHVVHCAAHNATHTSIPVRPRMPHTCPLNPFLSSHRTQPSRPPAHAFFSSAHLYTPSSHTHNTPSCAYTHTNHTQIRTFTPRSENLFVASKLNGSLTMLRDQPGKHPTTVMPAMPTHDPDP